MIRTLSPLPAPPPADPAAAALGQALFFDPGLSGDGQISCASCHQPDRSFTDGLALAIGAARGRRNTPTLLGASFQTFLTWDGRKDSLWSQALEPLEAEAEHATTRLAVARRVILRHRGAYEQAFGPLPDDAWLADLPTHARPVPSDPAHPHHRAWTTLTPGDQRAIDRVFVDVGRALEAYQRRLVPGPAPFDRYVAALQSGQDGQLSPGARRGLRWFIGPGRCVTCHNGPWFTDRAFHNLGVAADRGRAEGAERLLADPFGCSGDCPELRHLDPTLPSFVGAYRTPTLRDVARTAPYFHAGQLRTLDDVLAFYRELPGEPAVGARDDLLRSVDPAIPAADVIDFLRSLSTEPPEAALLVAPDGAR